jgi:hypothetical protein
MTRITLDYEDWDGRTDVVLHRPGTLLGYSIINNAIEVGHLTSKKAERRDATIAPSVDGVIELLAGALEWLRWYGMPAAEVQNRVRAFINANVSRQDATTLRATNAARGISDPGNRAHLLSPETQLLIRR